MADNKKDKAVEAATVQLQEEIAALTLENAELKEINEKLTAENAELKKPTQGVAIDVKGFALEIGDPYANAVIRAYLQTTKAKQVQAPVVPFVLPYNDIASKTALESYILRASAAGDTNRVNAAKKALKKVEK